MNVECIISIKKDPLFLKTLISKTVRRFGPSCIKLDLNEMGGGATDWIHVAQNMVRYMVILTLVLGISWLAQRLFDSQVGHRSVELQRRGSEVRWVQCWYKHRRTCVLACGGGWRKQLKFTRQPHVGHVTAFEIIFKGASVAHPSGYW